MHATCFAYLIIFVLIPVIEPEQRSRYSASLWARRSMDRIMVGTRFPALKTGPGVPQPPVKWVSGFFIGGKVAAVGC
jgi:hypothetical protein